MWKLVSVKEMQIIEAEANAKGLSYEHMMENAGRGLAEIIKKKYLTNGKKSVLGIVGSGNNGGDTLVALSALSSSGHYASVYIIGERPKDDPYIAFLTQSGGEVVYHINDKSFKQLDKWMQTSDILLDGVLGTGIHLPLKAEVATVLKHIKTLNHHAEIVAVDCPSGINADDGSTADEAFHADMTVCMAAVKTGLMTFPAFSFCGKIEVVDIGLPDTLPSWKSINQYVITPSDISPLLPVREIDSHKGTYGTVMIVAGSVNYSGAALLSARAASRTGAGLVRLAVPGPLHAALAGHIPESTWLILPHEMGVIDESAYEVLTENLDRVTALLIGPGIGTENTTAVFIQNIVSHGKAKTGKAGIGFVGSSIMKERTEMELPPMVIDADGLKLLAKVPDWPKLLPKNSILTPHPGEMSVLCGLPIEEIQTNRLLVAGKYAQLWGHTLVLKGALSIIASPDGRCVVVPAATSALAHAGTGDVLAGMIVGYRAQGLGAFESSIAATFIHAQAGLDAAVRIGTAASVLPIDVLASIPETIKNLTGY